MPTREIGADFSQCNILLRDKLGRILPINGVPHTEEAYRFLYGKEGETSEQRAFRRFPITSHKLGLCGAFLMAFLLSSFGVVAATNPSRLTLTAAATAFSASGLNMIGIAQNNIVTNGSYQYIVYFDTARTPRFVRRSLVDNSLTQYNPGLPAIASGSVGINYDEHKIAAIAIDTGGFIHLAYGMHADPLIYYKSNSPLDPSAFTSIGTMLGTNEASVTYPMFITSPSTGDLWFTFRDGTAGNGDQYFYHYTVGTTTWAAAAGTGSGGIIINGKTNTLSAYLNGLPRWDGSGNLWWSWQFYNGTNAFNEYVLKWNGTTFTTATGGAQTIPATQGNATAVVTIGSSGLLDQNSIYIDSSGVLYIGYQRNDGGGVNQIWVSENHTGSFVEHQITSFTTPNFPIGSLVTMMGSGSTVSAIYTNGFTGDNLVHNQGVVIRSSTNHFTSSAAALMNYMTNPNFSMTYDPVQFTSNGKVTFLWIDMHDSQYGDNTYQFSTPTGTLYLYDWTPSASLTPQPIILSNTTLTSWPLPADWSGTNQVEVVAGGGGGGGANNTNGASGGGGGAYSTSSNIAGLSSPVSVGIGAGGTAGATGSAGGNGGDSWFNGTAVAGSTVGAKGGVGGGLPTNGTGGLASSGTGGTKNNGGNAGVQNNNRFGGSGGGGAGGSGGAGAKGGQSATGTFAGDDEGTGGGGNGNGSQGVDANNATSDPANGTAGGAAADSTAGGAGGIASGGAGVAGTHGSGGGGGASTITGTNAGGAGAAGGNGLDFQDGAIGGGGGGGAAGGNNTAASTGAVGGAGGLFGGGGGSSSSPGTGGTGASGGAGASGAINIIYTPAVGGCTACSNLLLLGVGG